TFRTTYSFVIRGDDLPWIVDLRLLHHRHRRVDAAPCRFCTRVEWRGTAHQLLGIPHERMGILAVSAQHERRVRDRFIFHGRGRRIFHLVAQGFRVRRIVPPRRNYRRCAVVNVFTVSVRRWPGAARGQTSTDDPRRDGRVVPYGSRCGHRTGRTTEYNEPVTR